MLRTLVWVVLFALGVAACASQVVPMPPHTPTFPHPATRVLPTLLPTPTPVPAQTPAITNKRGIHLMLDDGRNNWPTEVWAAHLRAARDLVGEWGYVVELVRSDDLIPARWQLFFDLCARLRLQPVLRLATTFERDKGWWAAPPADPDGSDATIASQYASFVSKINWPETPHYVIVGNEPNHGDEWGGMPDSAAYARFLVDVSRALHTSDPRVKVLNGALDYFTPNTNGQPFVNGQSYLDAESFMDGMYTSHPNVFTAIDVWASHPYPLGPMSAEPWHQTFAIDLLNGATNPHHVDPPPGIFNRGLNSYEWELFKLSTYGRPDLPVMITETGWRHAESTEPEAADNGRPWPAVKTVAAYVDLAFYGNQHRYPDWPEAGWQPWQSDSRVIAVAFFALNGQPKEWGHTNWLELDTAGNILGTYPMYEALMPTGEPPLPP